MHTVRRRRLHREPQKTCHPIFIHNFGKYWPIKKNSLLGSAVHSQQGRCHISNRALNVSLHYLVKYKSSIIAILNEHCESKKLDPFLFEHNFRKYCPILINQSIKINLYSAMRRKRIRGAYWRALSRMFTFTICNIEQFSF